VSSVSEETHNTASDLKMHGDTLRVPQIEAVVLSQACRVISLWMAIR
jgi:uncharacterized protein YvpB